MQQPSDFTRMAEAGAVIVSGSQSHFPQGFAFRPGSIVHFGLGNLFFDQMEPQPIRRAFIDWHVFYGGKYLGVRLVTVMQEDFGRPRPMTADERALFLEDVFQANGWKP
jgi:poly-gamma-glutamate synthesis protein (capsule biosynthesis protein)